MSDRMDVFPHFQVVLRSYDEDPYYLES